MLRPSVAAASAVTGYITDPREVAGEDVALGVLLVGAGQREDVAVAQEVVDLGGVFHLPLMVVQLAQCDVSLALGRQDLALDVGGDLLNGLCLFVSVHVTCTGLPGSRPAGGLWQAADGS